MIPWALQLRRQLYACVVKLENYVLPLGYGVSHPYSPGYCGWHVTQQKFFFSLLPEQPCGVRLSESSLMSPIKSVSGVIAVGERIVKRKYGCETLWQKQTAIRIETN